jgi:glutathione S-transferase
VSKPAQALIVHHIEDGSLKMVESGAILEYLLLRHREGRLRP